jgi:hypothetical protein
MQLNYYRIPMLLTVILRCTQRTTRHTISQKPRSLAYSTDAETKRTRFHYTLTSPSLI